MSRKSKISLSNRALFYQSRKEQQPLIKTSQNPSKSQTELEFGSVGLGDLDKQETPKKRNYKSSQARTKPKVVFVRKARIISFFKRNGQTLQSNDTTLPASASLSKDLEVEQSLTDLEDGLSVKSGHLSSFTALLKTSKWKHLLSFSNATRSNLATEVSVEWFERLGFIFFPFAFIFGTTFFFTALASTLQNKMDHFDPSLSYPD
jgi:hypothetical protein